MIKKLSNSKVSFEFKIEVNSVKKQEPEALKKLSEKIKVSGFRPGNIPENVIRSKFTPTEILQEAFYKELSKEYYNFIKTNKLQPINSPNLDFKPPETEKNFPVTIKGDVEVYPEFEMGNYKKIKISRKKVELEKDSPTQLIESIMNDMNLGTEVKRAAQEKDQVIVSFSGKDKDGKVLPRTTMEKTPIRIGMNHFLADLENGIIGMKSGEKKEKVAVKFPKEYPAKEMAGKTVYFDIELNSIHEVSAKNLTEEMVEKITGKKKPVPDFLKDIEKNLKQQKESQNFQNFSNEYTKDAVKLIKGDIPESWVNKSTQEKYENITNNPQFKENPEAFWEAQKTNPKDFITSTKKSEEENIKGFLALKIIVEKEGIELDKDEKESLKKQENPEEREIMIKINKYIKSIYDETVPNK